MKFRSSANSLMPCLLIAVAGAGAIVSQITWQRYVAQLLGQSSLTVAAIIGMSLLGLAAGNLWSGARPGGNGRGENGRDGKRRGGRIGFGPIRFASVMLAAQGVVLVSMPHLFRLFWTPDEMLGGTPGVQPFAWTILLAIPVMVTHFFAGAILPGLLRHRGADASSAGWLSALETLGGCIGALTTGCLLLELWGMHATAWRCGGFTIAISMVVFYVDGWTRPLPPVSVGGDAPARSEAQGTMALWLGVLLAGIASLGLEISWQRLAILIVGTDGYSLTILITAYLIGISAGAALAASFLKRARSTSANAWRSRVALLQLFGGLVSILVLTAIVHLASGLGQSWLASPGTVIGFGISPLAKRFLLCLGLFVIPALLQGASWPVLVQAMSGGVSGNRNPSDVSYPSDVSSIAATIYAVVALGNVLGVLFAGFVLIPWGGVQLTVVSLVGVTVMAAWLIASGDGLRTRVVVSAVVVGICLLRVVTWSPVGLSIDASTTVLRYYREGPMNTVAVTELTHQPDVRQMVVDGVVIGQSGGNVEEKQLMLAHLPALLRHGQRPVRNAVVIGLGSGMLSRELASIEGVEDVTTVEISPSVIEASELFDDLGPNPTAEMSIVAADGYGWLGRQSRRFDAIISDGKSRPGHVGNSMFFSLDYYLTVLTRLTDDGVFVQWVSLDSEVREIETVLRTFSTGFPYAHVAIAAPGSIYLVGGKQPIRVSETNVASYFRLPGASHLAGYFWRNADDIRSMGWLQIPGGVFSRLRREHPEADHRFGVNTLDQPLLERISFDNRPRALQRNRVANVELLLELLESPEVETGIFNTGNANDRPAAISVLRSARTQMLARHGWLDVAAGEMRGAIRRLPRLSRGGFLSRAFGLLAEGEKSVAAQSVAAKPGETREIAYLKQAAKLLPGDHRVQLQVARRLMTLGRFDEALGFYQQAVRFQPNSDRGTRGVAAALMAMGKRTQAERVLREAGLESVSAELPFPVTAEAMPAVQPGQSASESPQTDQQRVDRLRELLRE